MGGESAGVGVRRRERNTSVICVLTHIQFQIGGGKLQ